jgi:CRP-like cAMP-binding protein
MSNEVQIQPRPLKQLLGNRLLAAVPGRDVVGFLDHFEQVALPPRSVLFDAGEEVTHVHFPAAGTVLSLVGSMSDGRTVELALIGCEGALGGVISAGRHLPATSRAVTQVGGAALRIEAGRLDDAKQSRPGLQDLLARFSDALLGQILQSVACNALHSVDERACRRLLEIQDRSGTDELPITQEHFAEVLGVQRTTVTRIVADLAATGAIEARRGRIHIASRHKLQAGACECWGAVRQHFEAVAPGLYPCPRG